MCSPTRHMPMVHHMNSGVGTQFHPRMPKAIQSWCTEIGRQSRVLLASIRDSVYLYVPCRLQQSMHKWHGLCNIGILLNTSLWRHTCIMYVMYIHVGQVHAKSTRKSPSTSLHCLCCSKSNGIYIVQGFLEASSFFLGEKYSSELDLVAEVYDQGRRFFCAR